MKIPEDIFNRVKDSLWGQADRDSWISLSDQVKSGMYEQWSTDSQVGGVLSQFMDKAAIRVYLKDTIMKPYVRDRTSNGSEIMKALGISVDDIAIQDFEKPHGRFLFSKRVVCWGQARDWKAILLAVYERAYRNTGEPYAAVLSRGVGKMAQPYERSLVSDLAKRLGIKKIVWTDQ